MNGNRGRREKEVAILAKEDTSHRNQYSGIITVMVIEAVGDGINFYQYSSLSKICPTMARDVVCL